MNNTTHNEAHNMNHSNEFFVAFNYYNSCNASELKGALELAEDILRDDSASADSKWAAQISIDVIADIKARRANFRI